MPPFIITIEWNDEICFRYKHNTLRNTIISEVFTKYVNTCFFLLGVDFDPKKLGIQHCFCKESDYQTLTLKVQEVSCLYIIIVDTINKPLDEQERGADHTS